MKVYHKFLLYQNKWLKPYIDKVLTIMQWITYLCSVALFIALIFEKGFSITASEALLVHRVYKIVWIVFLIDITLPFILAYRSTKKSFRHIMWILSLLLYLTLIPVVFNQPDEGGAVLKFWLLTNHPLFRLTLLVLLSFMNLSYGLIKMLGSRTNPSHILAGSFIVIILIGSGLLMLPKCTVDGISWVDSLFVATSSVCVTGLSPVDIATTFTSSGLTIIAILIQIGGLGVMTFTSFFALFFMGNTSLFSQIAVRNVMKNESLNSLLSTILYILFFTLVIEGVGMFAIWTSIHDTLNLSIEEELAFSAFHSISAFCNAGISSFPEGLANPLIQNGSNSIFIYIACLVLLGGIGFPILVNFKDIFFFHIKRFVLSIKTRRWQQKGRRHLYNLNTRIVLITTFILVLSGFILVLLFEWNNALEGMRIGDKLTHAFFTSVTPRSAGFSNIDISSFRIQTLMLFVLYMWIGGASQSTAGGVKVNTIAVVFLNIKSVIKGSDRIEVLGRELSYESIRRSNAAVVISLITLFVSLLIMTFLEPSLPFSEIAIECVAALSTAGSGTGITEHFSVGSRLFITLLMFVGRVGIMTLMFGFVRQRSKRKYHYPSDHIIIN
ncbi:MAG: potassium transporter [Bacteroidales bacterium]|nr:potassium transporter [Bacteroidales bacterium]